MAKGTRKSAIRKRQARSNKRRKGALAVFVPWMKRFGVVLGVVVFVLWVGAWLWLSGSFVRAAHWSQNQVIELAASAGFKVENILVEGRKYADADVLLALINIQKGDPLFSFDPAQARALIEQMEWVASVHVERRLPDTLYIGLEEREPLALWQRDKKLYLLDRAGKEIKTDRLHRFSDFVIVMGRDAPQNVAELMDYLSAEPLIRARSESAKYISGRRWNLTLKNGILIKLPESDMGLALSRLARAQEDEGLMDKDIIAIDLRDTLRMTIRTKPGAVQEYKSSLKTGNRI